MGHYRVALLINGDTTPPPSGWSERYDFEFSSDSAAFSFGNALANRRLSFLGSNYYMYGYRVSVITSQAKKPPSVLYRLHQASVQICGFGINKFGTASYGIDPYSALFYRAYAEGSPGKPSKREFRGWPQAWWITPGKLKTAAVEGEVQAWFQFLKMNGWVKLVLNKMTGSITPWPFTCLEFQRIAKKATGRPFGLARGRRFSHHAPPS